MQNRLTTKEKIWLIGASDGIGKAIAVALQELPLAHEIYISARREAVLQQIVDESKKNISENINENPKGQLIAKPCDVLDVEQLKQIWHELPQDINRIVFLVATYTPMNLKNFSTEKVSACHQMLQVNLQSFIDLLGIILPSIEKRFQETGSITHLSIVSSVAGYVGLPNGLVYGGTKAALTHMAETLASEGENIGLEVSVIHPGFVKSQLTAKNDFPMPFILEPHEAAKRVLHGWKKGHFEIVFPKRLAFILKLLRLLPYSWQLFITKKIKVD